MTARNPSVGHWKALGDREFCKDVKLFVGMMSPELPQWIGRPFLYMDHNYFRTPPLESWFRLVRDDIHLTQRLERPDDRWKRHGKEVQPWQKDGESIVVIPPSVYVQRLYPDAAGWCKSACAALERVTDRPVVVKRDKTTSFPRFLVDNKAFAVVTYASVAGVEASILGYPVFAGPHCPALPISAGQLEDVERPVYHDREPWLYALAYATWNIAEFPNINLKDYDYCESRYDVPQGGL